MPRESTQSMRVSHVITGLNDGGAEAVLFRLCNHDTLHQHFVISLTDEGKYGPLLASNGIEVQTCGMAPNRPSPLAFIKLVQLLRRQNPDVVQTWMYHADLVGGVAARIAGIKSIVWGIRHTTLEPGKSKKTTIWIAKLLAKLSRWLPSQIAVCARRAIDVHVSLGYDRAKMHYIPNGYDFSEFVPKPDEALHLRAQLGVANNIPLVGTVGRYDPQKDHANLLRGLSILRNRSVSMRCLLVGTNLDEDNKAILNQVYRLGLEKHVLLLGKRTDIPTVMSALDLHILPSAYGEAFPNVVAEAMACETPCVVTDVGDAAHIVGDTGWVVPPRDAESLANAIQEALLEKESGLWAERCRSARVRVQGEFDISKMVDAYHDLWRQAL